MSDLRTAAEMALKALEDIFGKEKKDVGAINALRQALAWEWVCCVCGDPKALGIVHSADAPCFHYTKREWVGLTDREIEHELTQEFAHWWNRHVSVCRAIETKLKDKNT
jgi:hypothetical protein